jgi:hypothetical protein
VRTRSRQFIEELLRGELDAALARPRLRIPERSPRSHRGSCRNRKTSFAHPTRVFGNVASAISAIIPGSDLRCSDAGFSPPRDNIVFTHYALHSPGNISPRGASRLDISITDHRPRRIGIEVDSFSGCPGDPIQPGRCPLLGEPGEAGVQNGSDDGAHDRSCHVGQASLKLRVASIGPSARARHPAHRARAQEPSVRRIRRRRGSLGSRRFAASNHKAQ